MDYADELKDLNETLSGFFRESAAAFEEMTREVAERLKKGKKLLVFGNGGSAAQAQHLAAELVNKFQRERAPLRAVSLTTDTSILTSVANDFSFDRVFSRQVETLGQEGDVALALSTSGHSPNIVEALKAARAKKMLTVAMTGKGGGRLAGLADRLIAVPSSSTPRIQEVHLFLLHLLAAELEKDLP